MSIDDKIRQLWQDMDRVSACHPSRLPSWVTAAAIAAGLTLTTGACTRDRPAEDTSDHPAQMGRENPDPGDTTPAEGNLYGGPPMNERPVMNPPPIPPYGAVIPSPMEAGPAPETMEATPMKTPMRRPGEPVTDYGAPFL